MTEKEIEIAKLIVSILGFGGAIATFYFAYRQYKRAEQWKRGEFLAKEIKEFESNPTVRNALLMIDWGRRRINLFQAENPTRADYYVITREDQWKALLPHPIKPAYPSSSWSEAESTGEDEEEIKFSSVEARIRDTYDVFLDHLERFANFIKSGLVTPDEFKPYLIYWIDSLSRPEGGRDDSTWRCVLFTYITYYNYPGVKYLFEAYGRNIDPDGKLYQGLKRGMDDDLLFDKLYGCVSSGSAV